MIVNVDRCSMCIVWSILFAGVLLLVGPSAFEDGWQLGPLLQLDGQAVYRHWARWWAQTVVCQHADQLHGFRGGNQWERPWHGSANMYWQAPAPSSTAWCRLGTENLCMVFLSLVHFRFCEICVFDQRESKTDPIAWMISFYKLLHPSRVWLCLFRFKMIQNTWLATYFHKRPLSCLIIVDKCR